MGTQVIVSEIRDSRFITVRRGGTLQDTDHRLLAVWAADCAQHVLHFFEQEQPNDDRPRRAIEQAHVWVRGEITMAQARTAAFAAHAAAREAFGAAKEAARAAGQQSNKDQYFSLRNIWSSSTSSRISLGSCVRCH